DYRRACRTTGGQLVPGPHGVWSTLARCTLDPGRSALTNHPNLKVKYRESLRPFAPSVLR
ncbi:MAG: hypothetical protein WCD54_20600, partial [Pseudolabrys sp.]